MFRNRSLGFLAAALLVTGSLAAAAQAAPATPATGATPATPAAKAAPAHVARSHMARTDLNSASKEQLMQLPGVNESLADRIIAARPFKSRGELVSKKLMTAKEYKAISNRLTAQNGHEAAPKVAAVQAKTK